MFNVIWAWFFFWVKCVLKTKIYNCRKFWKIGSWVTPKDKVLGLEEPYLKLTINSIIYLITNNWQINFVSYNILFLQRKKAKCNSRPSKSIICKYNTSTTSPIFDILIPNKTLFRLFHLVFYITQINISKWKRKILYQSLPSKQ